MCIQVVLWILQTDLIEVVSSFRYSIEAVDSQLTHKVRAIFQQLPIISMSGFYSKPSGSNGAKNNQCLLQFQSK